MMTHSEARAAFMRLIADFDYPDLEQDYIFTQNQSTTGSEPLNAPEDKLWCRVFIRNAPSFITGLADSPCTRTVGNLIIQCFDRRGNDTVALTELCDAWIKHLQFKQVNHLEMLQGSAIDVGESEDFYQMNVVVEYRIN